MSRATLVVVERSPAYYREPIYRDIARDMPSAAIIIYYENKHGSQFYDADFGQNVSYADTKTLDGYEKRVITKDGKKPRCDALEIIDDACLSPVIVFCEIASLFGLALLLLALARGSEVWVRTETSDVSRRRTCMKTTIRRIFYIAWYKVITGALCIGKANRHHLLSHGVKKSRIWQSAYGVDNIMRKHTASDLEVARVAVRERLGLSNGETVILFVGKLIEKKNPMLAIEAVSRLSSSREKQYALIYVGNGPLRKALKDYADICSIKCIMVGFVPQSEINDMYLAADILVLPSRRLGETWGLVVNEALGAGLGVCVSTAVGCRYEFSKLERVRVFKDGSVGGLAVGIQELSRYARDFKWAEGHLLKYAPSASAQSFLSLISRGQVAPRVV